MDSSRSASDSSSFGRREHAADVVAGLQNRDRLVDDVILVGLEVLGPALLDQLDDPARIEIDAEADPAAVLAQMLDGEPQAPGTRRPEHQPVRAARKLVVRQRTAEQLVVDAEVFARDARFRNARRAAGLEDVDRLAGQPLRNPALHRTTAQPFILELAEPLQVTERADFAPRIPSGLPRELEPERCAGHGIEVPVDDFAHPAIECVLRPAGWRRQHGIVV